MDTPRPLTDSGVPRFFAGVSPTRASAALALLYLLIAGTYIVLSSTLASERAADVEQLKSIELVKGIAFVIVSSLGIYIANVSILRLMRKHEGLERRMERALANAERSVLAGTFARTIAHDINNALSSSMLILPLLRERVENDPESAEYVDGVMSSVNRIAEWNRRFFEIGGKRLAAESKTFDLGTSVAATVELARHHRHVRNAKLEYDRSHFPDFHGVESVVQRAVLNLILNAAEAAGKNAQIRVGIAALDGLHIISVEDNGPGVPQDLRERILEPFFTSKNDGTGLGLASVVACARLHSGTVSVGTSSLGGAIFVCTLGAIDPNDPAFTQPIGEPGTGGLH